MRAFLILCILSSLFAEDFPKERLDIDPSIQGVWMVQAVSDDKGKTVEHAKPPFVLARASAGKLVLPEGTWLVESVLITKTNGKLGNIIKFRGRTASLYVGDQQDGMNLVQMFEQDGEKFKEVRRWVITVE